MANASILFYALTTLSLNAPWFLFMRRERGKTEIMSNSSVHDEKVVQSRRKRRCERQIEMCCFVLVFERNLSSASTAKAFMRKDSLSGCP